MELKDVILSTLAEMEDSSEPQVSKPLNQISAKKTLVETAPRVEEKESENSSLEGELLYLSSIKERLLVLFEGFQAPNNANIEAKVDMTLNFLEYTLATIDARIEILGKGRRL